MFYQVKRTYITRAGDETTMKSDRRTDYVEAANAFAATEQFFQSGACMQVGEIVKLPDDSATATCYRAGVTFVIRVTPIGKDEIDARRAGAWNEYRRRKDDPQP